MTTVTSSSVCDMRKVLEDVLEYAVSPREFGYLSKGIGNKTPKGMALLAARAALAERTQQEVQPINYFIVGAFASKHNIDYNAACVMVQEALRLARPTTAASAAPTTAVGSRLLSTPLVPPLTDDQVSGADSMFGNI